LTPSHGWVTVDIIHGRINCVGEMENMCKKPILYIVAINNDGTLKDLTKKYVSPSTFLTQTRKIRVSQDWLDQVFDPFKPRMTPEEKAENEKMEKRLMVNSQLKQKKLFLFLFNS
jgi:xeroderma pigmentosum group C-complementing protein